MKVIRIFQTKKGNKPFLEWIDSLKDSVTKARIKRRIDRLQLGNYGDYKALGDDVFELRLKFGSGYRVYFTEHNNEIIILLCGGDKSTQAKDIKKAKKYCQELQEKDDD